MSSAKRVWITGAASGIGRATAIRFAREGYQVCLQDWQADRLQTVRESLPDGNHLVFSGSIADEAAMARVGHFMNQQWGGLDALVNCAGVFAKTSAVGMSLSEWQPVFDLFIQGAWLATQVAAGLMQNGGRIIHITSIHGERAEAQASSYSMAKAAVNQYCRSLAVELADRNILVNAIAPGFVRTPMSVVNGEDELESEWFRTHYINGHHLPLRRPAEPEEIAGVAWFLAGKDASYLTGQVVSVDGGLTITF